MYGVHIRDSYATENKFGARWPLGWHRRLGKRVSSVVLCFDGTLPVKGSAIWFLGWLCPVEGYEFGRGVCP